MLRLVLRVRCRGTPHCSLDDVLVQDSSVTGSNGIDVLLVRSPTTTLVLTTFLRWSIKHTRADPTQS